MIGYAELY